MTYLDSNYRLVSTPTGLEDSWLISYERKADWLKASIECWNAKVADLVFLNPIAMSDYGTLYTMYLGEYLNKNDIKQLFPYIISDRRVSESIFSLIDTDEIATLNVMCKDYKIIIREPFSEELISVHDSEALDLHIKPITGSENVPLMNCKFNAYSYHSKDQTLTISILDEEKNIISLNFFCIKWFSEFNIEFMAKFAGPILHSDLLRDALSRRFLISPQEHDFKHLRFLTIDNQPCVDIICRAVTVDKKENDQQDVISGK